MKKTLLTLPLILIMGGIMAQDDELSVAPNTDQVFTKSGNELPDPKVTIDIDIRAAFTSGEFKQFYPKPGMGGIGGTFMFPLEKRNPIDVGFGLGYYFMSNSEETYGYYAPGVGDYDVTSTINGGMFAFHLVSRVYPLKSTGLPIQPFAEGLAGIRVFSATQRLETYMYSTDQVLPPQEEFNYSSSWSYGFGGGVRVMVDKNNVVAVVLKYDQLYGTTTTNMDPSSVVLYDDGTYTYEEFKSETDVQRFTIGVQILIE